MSYLNPTPDQIKNELSQLRELTRPLAATGFASDKLFTEKINRYRKTPKSRVIEPVGLYVDCIRAILTNPDFNTNNYTITLNYAESVYSQIFVLKEATPDFEFLAMIFLSMFSSGGTISRRIFDIRIFNLFANKQNYLKWVDCIKTNRNFNEFSNQVLAYGIEARCYFPDEDAFTANYIYVSDKLMHSLNPDDALKEEIKRVEHMVGIYDVDEATILRVEQQVSSAIEIVNRAGEVLSATESKIRALETLADDSASRVQTVCTSEVEIATAKLREIDSELRKAYNSFLDSQKAQIQLDKEELVSGVVADAETKLAELRKTAQGIVSAARMELSSINTQVATTLARLDSCLDNNQRLEDLLSKSEASDELLNKIDRLMLLNDRNIDAAINTVNAAAASEAPAQAAVVSVESSGAQPSAPVEVIDPVELPPINPLLDETISFKQRFEHVLKNKQKMEAEGVHFHKMFDDVLMAVMENANPYLIGPSGCGKTYMVGQIAKLLNADFIDIGYINEEYDILGFQTANGGYSRPNFYRCYKYGKIAFCDELDNGNSRATVKLNSFLSNNSHAGYSFPNGEFVKRHGNFRIIGAGNTAGNGADSIYNTRERIEESVQQRFTPIYIGYDNEVERAILGDYSDWFEFVELFRNATDAWSRSSHSEAPGIITTRDVTRIRKYLDNGSFNMPKIIDYEFIQTKDESYLAFLSANIQKNIKADSKARTIAECFIRKIGEMRSRYDK